MKTRLIILSMSFLMLFSASNAQQITGFWGVDQVKVGDRNLTPVAKWFRYEKDRTYKAGNGWTQNDIGTWAYDEAKKEFLPQTSRGMKDDYGAFKVRFSGNQMFWEREEDSMQVIVTLSRIKEMPMSPKDSIAGRWDLVVVKKDGRDITKTYDADDKELLEIRWTETYRKTNPDDTQAFGYWHMDAHSPEFHLIDFNREVDVQVFYVLFKDDLLMMRPKNDEDMLFTYRRE